MPPMIPIAFFKIFSFSLKAFFQTDSPLLNRLFAVRSYYMQILTRRD